TLQGQSRRLDAVDTVSFERLPSGHTRVRYVADLSFKDPYRWLERAMKPLLVRMGRKAVAGLKRALDTL
ncbi:MAG: hypothetical protein KC561_20985, partial [Myxococcales bacterium]|nr:hypothetical protein [Myxococcales bacterium]